MQSEKTSRKVNIEELLAEGKSVRLHPQGYSMYPLFIPDRDEAVIAPMTGSEAFAGLKRGDVVLYRRESGILVLHRIWKRKENDFYMVGDNQKEIEGPLSGEQIKGVLAEIIRNGKHFTVKQPVYRLLSGIWLMLRSLRPFLSKSVAALKRLFKSV